MGSQTGRAQRPGVVVPDVVVVVPDAPVLGGVAVLGLAIVPLPEAPDVFAPGVDGMAVRPLRLPVEFVVDVPVVDEPMPVCGVVLFTPGVMPELMPPDPDAAPDAAPGVALLEPGCALPAPIPVPPVVEAPEPPADPEAPAPPEDCAKAGPAVAITTTLAVIRMARMDDLLFYRTPIG